MQRYNISIAGESGSGLLSMGDMLCNAFHRMGFYVVADREYPSLIKGGHARFRMNISTEAIHSLSEQTDILLAIDKPSLLAYFPAMNKGGLLMHGYERLQGMEEIHAKAKRKKIKVLHVMARELAQQQGASPLMANMVLMGMFWKALGLPYNFIENEVKEKFKNKPALLELDLKCLKAGFDVTTTQMKLEPPQPKKRGKHMLIDGNRSLTLGAIHAGVRAYFAYPMSPASSILTHMGEYADEYGILVKQVEDEISVANITLGAMFMGTRALAATSGGGYDLMTETVSLAGIIECPLVLVIAQRPGPGTGLPTWTSQGDLNLAIHSGHGELSRVVLGVSDPSDCFDLIQHAFNLAEEYQSVVIVLTEKSIAETHVTTEAFKMKKIPIKRGLVTGKALQSLQNTDRFKITPSGLSKRWIPGSSPAYYFSNSDEHGEDGSICEDSPLTARMHDKRMKKQALLEKALPEPVIYGTKKNADISFVGWGSSKNVMLDIVDQYAQERIKVNYLHYSYLYPLKTNVAKKFFEENKNVHLIESNYKGQLGDMVEGQIHKHFKSRLIKYDGRPFFLEDVTRYISKKLR